MCKNNHSSAPGFCQNPAKMMVEYLIKCSGDGKSFHINVHWKIEAFIGERKSFSDRDLFFFLSFWMSSR